MQINTNGSSMITQNYLRLSNQGLATAMERLSSGRRINSAADDAAGLAIATRMSTKIKGLEVGVRNSNDGMSMIQTGEAGLGSISNILQRMRDLGVQAVNGTNSADDRASLDTEFQELMAEITHIAQNTTFNGISLLDGTAGTVNIQLSDVGGDTLPVTLTDAQVGALTATAGFGDITTAANAATAIDVIDDAIEIISTDRATYGAILNRLTFNIDNITSQKNNLAQAKSRVEDADMALEVSEMTKNKILVQSGVSMLSQANQNPEMVLKLLG